MVARTRAVHQLVEIGGAADAEEIDGLNHALRASERLQRSLELAGAFFETPAVGDRRLHAVAAGAQARRRRRFRAGRHLQQLAEADAPGGGQPLGAIRGQRAQRRPRHRIELHPHRLAGPGELAVRVDQAVQLVPQRFGGSALPVALEQHVGGEPIPVLEALYVGRPARAQQVVRKTLGAPFSPGARRRGRRRTPRRPAGEKFRHLVEHRRGHAERRAADDGGQSVQHFAHPVGGGIEGPGSSGWVASSMRDRWYRNR